MGVVRNLRRLPTEPLRRGRNGMRPRDTYRYVGRDGRQVVIYGISDHPEVRAYQHELAGKRITGVTVVGPPVTRDAALEWERAMIEAYQRSHGGRKPRYNKA
jgi:hypothetical protein